MERLMASEFLPDVRRSDSEGGGAMSSSEREVYSIDSKGRIRRYQNKVTFEFFKGLDERRIYKKDLPKDYEVYREYVEYDI